MSPWILLFALACRGDSDDLSDDTAAPADTAADTDAADTDRGRDDTGGGGDDTGPAETEPTERRWDCSGIDPADPGPLGGVVALTFDDGPDTESTAAILETLRDYQAPATFFVLGERLESVSNWDIVEEIIDDPLFDIANHSWDHSNMADLSLSDVQDQVASTNAIIETFGISPAFFRFPYGASDCDRVDLVGDEGQLVAGWHIDTADWCYAAVGAEGVCTRDDYWRVPEEYEADMIGFTMEQIRRFDGGVVLFHDIHDYTAEQLPILLEILVDEGYELVALKDSDAFPLLNAGEPADLPYLGEPCETDNDLCWQVEYEAWCEPTDPGDPASNEGICTIPCEGYCLDRDGAATTFCATVPPGAGQCASQAVSLNGYCDDVPGTSEQSADRFVGESGVSSATADVCIPDHWLDQG